VELASDRRAGRALLRRAPKASVIGIDADPGILAPRRPAAPPGRGTLHTANFVGRLCRARDAVVASFALHHVRTRDAKTRLYRASALRFARAVCSSAPIVIRGAPRALDGPAKRVEAHLRASYTRRRPKPSCAPGK